MTLRRRSNGFYQYRGTIPGRGDVARTIGTRRVGVARRRYAAIRALIERGRLDLINGWLDGLISLAQIVEAYDSGRIDRLTRTLAAAHVPALEEACDEVLRTRRPDVRATTLERYATGFQHLVAFHGASVPVNRALTQEAVGEFKAHRLAKVKPGTVNKDLQTVSLLSHHAQRKGWIRERPVIRKIGVAPKTITIHPSEQAVYLAGLRPPFRPILAFLLAAGCRLAEAECLTVDDVRQLEDGSWWASITRAKTTAGVRSIPIPRSTAEQLATRIDEQGLLGADPVFQPIPRRTVQKEHERVAKVIGLPKGYSIHRHRDTYAVTMARRGMPIPALQRILGHKTIQQTMKYAAYQPEYADVQRYVDPEFVSPGTKSGTAAWAENDRSA
ncbi:tyrosine-type recombinase/integrase [Candidatus Palauibacter sp.]|uniref:tyrosine-type recombinase/integrase n=1 Tax=Candidatus Palauibacter sp. TaxID=3101350 RepID=UPI003CC62C2A